MPWGGGRQGRTTSIIQDKMVLRVSTNERHRAPSAMKRYQATNKYQVFYYISRGETEATLKGRGKGKGLQTRQQTPSSLLTFLSSSSSSCACAVLLASGALASPPFSPYGHQSETQRTSRGHSEKTRLPAHVRQVFTEERKLTTPCDQLCARHECESRSTFLFCVGKGRAGHPRTTTLIDPQYPYTR